MTGAVDVIILSWNRADDTVAAIKSALEQQGVRKRVIVVDQGSTEDCVNTLIRETEGHPEVQLKFLRRNIGVPGGRNLAVRLGDAPYIVALDNDAVFTATDTLARAAERFERDENLGALAFRILNYFTGEDDEGCWDYPEPMRAHRASEFETTRFIGAGHALRRSVFEAVQGYDERLFFSGEERDLAYRMLNRGFRVRYSGDFIVRHKSDPEARVRWDGGRYYYTVRNALFTDQKCGYGYLRLLRAAGAMTVRGARNSVANQAIRGVADAARMSVGGRRDKSAAGVTERLSPEVRDYIESIESQGRGSVWERTARQFRRLPGTA